MRSHVKVAVVIPCYNTSGACVDVIAKARATADAVLVVDDGSTDDTPDHIRRTGSVCLRFEHNAGKAPRSRPGSRRC
jgi:glycosyltransferase involved in cell wall biosynthesis